MIRDHLIYTLTSAITTTVEATVMGLHLILTSVKRHLSFHPRGCLTWAEASSAAILRKIVKSLFSCTGHHHPEWSFLFSNKRESKGINMAIHCEEMFVFFFFWLEHAMHVSEFRSLPGKVTRNNTFVQVGRRVTR